MQTFADKPKMQVLPARSAVSGLWKVPQKADWKPDSVGVAGPVAVRTG